MKLSLITYFDTGVSFGINDHPFLSGEKIKKLETEISYLIRYPACDFPVGIDVPIGKGFRINLLNSFFMEDWSTEARKKAESDELKKVFESISIKDCYLTFGASSLH